MIGLRGLYHAADGCPLARIDLTDEQDPAGIVPAEDSH
jgi:hypothetical protein